MMKSALVVGGLVLALAVPNYAIVQKEHVLASGTPMLLALAPVDPRSLIGGYYMRLDYAITRTMAAEKNTWPRDGHIIVILDSVGVAQFVRRHEPGTPLSSGEHLLQYRRRAGRYRVGTDAFNFQEGLARHYQGARYGDLRVDDKGESVLVGLRDSMRVALQ